MKRNKVLRIASVLLVLALVTTVGMTGALAKYVKDFPVATNKVRAGLFRVTGPGTSEAILGTTLYDGKNVAEEVEQKKYTESTLGIIVPGTIIRVDKFKVVNYSEVDVALTIKSIALNAVGTTTTLNPALRYSIDGGTGWKEFTEANLKADSPTILGATNATLTAYPKGAAAAAKEITPNLLILWPYDNDTLTLNPDEDNNYVSANTDPVDTGFGEGQAAVLLNPDDGTADANKYKTAAGTDDPTTPQEYQLALTLTATQID